MTAILAIDPGTDKSAWVLYDSAKRAVLNHGKHDNFEVLNDLATCSNWYGRLVIEMVASYGRPVGEEVFETCVWIGRFIESVPNPDDVVRIKRADVKMHLCHATAKVNDAVIRQRLIDLFGPGESTAIGGVKCKQCHGKGWFGAGRPVCTRCNGSTWEYPPGPLYGITADCWQALALAVTYADRLHAAAVLEETRPNVTLRSIYTPQGLDQLTPAPRPAREGGEGNSKEDER